MDGICMTCGAYIVRGESGGRECVEPRLCYNDGGTNTLWRPISAETCSNAVKPVETDPNGIGQHDPGAKLDSGKIMMELLLTIIYQMKIK